jgi:hypothetical protein
MLQAHVIAPYARASVVLLGVQVNITPAPARFDTGSLQWEPLISQIESSAKPSGDFRETLVAFTIEARTLADESSIPTKTHGSDYYEPGALAHRTFAQFGCDNTFEFCSGLYRLLRHFRWMSALGQRKIG